MCEDVVVFVARIEMSTEAVLSRRFVFDRNLISASSVDRIFQAWQFYGCVAYSACKLGTYAHALPFGMGFIEQL